MNSFLDYDGLRHRLDHTYRSINNPDLLNHITLFPHQMTAIQALIDIEKIQAINIGNDHSNKRNTDSDAIIETKCVILSDPYGSGKSVIILGLIVISPLPAAYRRNFNIATKNVFSDEIIITYNGNDCLIKPTLIVVNHNVLQQWKKLIIKHTNCSVFVINSVKKLKQFEQIYHQNQINKYDIVLIKNGVTILYSDYFDSPSNLISIVGYITRYKCWSRVVYDDYDMLASQCVIRSINTLFTVFVSSTSDIINQNARNVNIDSCHLIDMLHDTIHYDIRNCVTYKELTYFNVSNNYQYIETSTQLTKINIYQYTTMSEYDNYMKLIYAMNDDEANTIYEMLTSDAINTAAEALCIKSNSIGDIFQRLLEKKYNNYVINNRILSFIHGVKTNIINLERRDDKYYTDEKIKSIRSNIIALKDPCIKYNSIVIENIVDQLIAEYNILTKSANNTINRLIENIKENNCQICATPLNECKVFIIKCCGLIVCNECSIPGNNIQIEQITGSDSHTVKGICTNCKSLIIPQRDLIFVDQNLDLLAACNNVNDIIKTLDVSDDTNIPLKEFTNPKLTILNEIIHNRIPESRMKVMRSINNLLYGSVDKPAPHNIDKKILIFSSYTESIYLITNLLDCENIKYVSITSHVAHINEKIEEFRTQVPILLISYKNNYAGINLEFVTDLVYFHNLMNKNIEGQIAGRAQRYGRKNNLNIHYLCYTDE